MLLQPSGSLYVLLHLSIWNIRILSVSGSLALQFVEMPSHSSSQGRLCLSSKPQFKCLYFLKAFQWPSPFEGALLMVSYYHIPLHLFILWASSLPSLPSFLLSLIYVFIFFPIPGPTTWQIVSSIYQSFLVCLVFSFSFPFSFLCHQSLGKPVHSMHWIHINWKKYMHLYEFKCIHEVIFPLQWSWANSLK